MNGPASGSLAAVRVIDLSRVLAGPYCSQMLADHGADVIKVEPPHGEETRNWGPPFAADGTSAYFAGLNRNKRNIALDLSTAAGQGVLADLLADADVLIENFKIGTLAKWGLSDELLRESYPRLIHCRITAFGATGPMAGMPGYDAVLQAYAGLMSVNGEASSGPLRIGVPIVDISTAMTAFAGILLALIARSRSQQGQTVDCSLLGSATSLLHPQAASWFASGVIPTVTGSAHPTIAPYEHYPTATEPIFIGAGSDRQFRKLLEVLALGSVADDPRFGSNADRLKNSESLRQILTERLADVDGAELSRTLLRNGVPSSPIHDIAEALSSTQARHQHLTVSLGDAYCGLGIPIKLSETPGSARDEPHHLGEDTADVLCALGYSDGKIDKLFEDAVAFGSSQNTTP